MLSRTVLTFMLLMTVLRGTAEVAETPKSDPNTTVPPAKPVWAAAVLKDEHGFFADLPISGQTQRMRWIKAGSFPIRDELGERLMTITQGYWLADSEVTQALWKTVMTTSPGGFTGDENRPVVQVSWDDGHGFCQRVNGLVPGLNAALPTEAQWEYACRAGTTDEYAGDLNALAWYARTTKDKKTQPVKTKQANAWGVYDMHGNAWEWCADWIGPYAAGAPRDPTGPEAGSQRVYRGGGFSDGAKWCRSGSRAGRPPNLATNYLGFRFFARATP